jgi:hypothetical protein
MTASLIPHRRSKRKPPLPEGIEFNDRRRAAGKPKDLSHVADPIRHTISFLQDAQELIHSPHEAHGTPPEEVLANLLKSSVEMLQLAQKRLKQGRA